MIYIQPLTFPLNKGTATHFDLKVSPFSVTDSSCSLYYLFYSEKGEIIDQGQLPLSEEEYNNWGQSNEYLIDLACEKLGVVKIPAPVE